MKDILKKAANFFDVELIDSDVKLYLTLTNNPAKKYEISEFDITFSQPKDHKGQPQNEIDGGFIEFSLMQLPDDIINKWMLDSTMQLDGQFSFERKAQNSVLKVTFNDTFCVSYDKIIGMGTSVTRLIISPGVVNINGKEKLKIWTR